MSSPPGEQSSSSSKPTNNHKKIHYAPDELVVNYHDACIYGRDLALLEESPTAWLNDACLHFALTDLQTQQQQSSCSSNNKTTIIFLDPAVVAFLMHQCHDDDEYQDFIQGACQGLTHDRVQALVVPINDTFLTNHQHWAVPGLGSHWSLLVLIKSSSLSSSNIVNGYHFDSIGSSNHNLAVAQAVADKILRAAAANNNASSSSWQQQKHARVVVQACATPQQGNGYDCGVHVIAAAQAIAATTSGGDSSNDEARRAYETKLAQLLEKYDACWNLRQTLAARIRQLANAETTR